MPDMQLRRHADAGFSLVELLVALLLIGVVISSLAALQIGSLETITLAKQRQTATALANQAIERLRSLPYGTLSQGLNAADAASDTGWISGGRLKAPWDERVVTSTDQADAALVPHVQTETVGSQPYTVRRYVTSPKDAGGADVISSNDFWLTAVVEWTSAVTKGQTKSVVVRNREVLPAGCKGSVEHPYAGPCQPFFHADANWSTGAITVSSSDPVQGLFVGSAYSQAAVVLPGIASNVEIEQVSSAQARAITSGTILGSVAGSGQVTGQVQSDIDPATGTASTPAPVTVSQQTTGLQQTISTPHGVLTLSPSTADSGGAASGALVNASTGCNDLAGVALTASRSCASSWVQPSGTTQAVVDLASVGGRDLAPMTLGSVVAPGEPARAFSARFTAGTAGHCAGTTGDGCAGAGARRSLGAVLVAGLPPAETGDQIPAGFEGMVQLTGYAEQATSEIGLGSAAIGTTDRFAVTRTGMLRVWTGTGYQQIDLSALASGQNVELGAATASYGNPDGGGVIQVVASGTVSIGGIVQTKTPSGACQPDSCTGEAQAGRIIATVSYVVSLGGTTVTSFQVSVDLGALVTTTSYRAVPDV